MYTQSGMVPRDGVEPSTLRLGGTRSIQLSYRGRVCELYRCTNHPWWAFQPSHPGWAFGQTRASLAFDTALTQLSYRGVTRKLTPLVAPIHGHRIAEILKPGDARLRKAVGGAEGDRTPDLRIANAALSQLSYRPESGGAILASPGAYRHGTGREPTGRPCWVRITDLWPAATVIPCSPCAISQATVSGHAS